MDDDRRPGVVVDEQARNRGYLEWLDQKTRTTLPVAVSRSVNWTRTGLPHLRHPVVHPLIGRVGLSEPVEGVGSDFYIGPWHHEMGAFRVFSWAAPVANAYFGSGSFPELDGKVQVTRAFRHAGNRIVDFDDERYNGAETPTAFDRKAPLQIQRPPATPAVNREHPTVPSPPSPDRPTAGGPDTNPPMTSPRRAAPAVPRPRREQPAFRHDRALRRALAEPRQGTLPNVLGTLQPDQYRLVTWPAEEPIVIQGNAGSGKTIVAVHRAAYLVNPERGEGALPGKVLLLGPTSNYTAHTQQVMNSLVAPGAASVMSVHDLFRKLLPDLPVATVRGAEDYRDYDPGLGRLVEQVASWLRTRGRLDEGPAKKRAEQVYNALRRHAAAAVRTPADWIEYLDELPDWKTALGHERFTPLLAYCALSVMPASLPSWQHMVIDEAQDVPPLAWCILSRLNTDCGWTILGDMNQRRSDCCYASWDLLATALGIDQDDRAPVHRFAAAYRSTAEILAFAGALLPAHERGCAVAQEGGPRPNVRKVPPRAFNEEAVHSAWTLHGRLPRGTLAIIATETDPLRGALARAGWSLARLGSDAWIKDDAVLRLLTPHDARGLEFDGVVVVEPATFPRNLGHHGVLYTSLTRPTRELCVVHALALPDALRKAGR